MRVGQKLEIRFEFFKFVFFSVMIVATGLSLPNIPPIVGIEFAKGYENVSLNVDEFENQTVLILGSKTEIE